MSHGRAVDVLGRFAGHALEVGGRRGFAPGVARRVVAASTEAQLAVLRIRRLGRAGVEVLEAPAELRGASGWAEVVFRANGAAIAALDRLAPGAIVELELADRVGFYLSRDHLPNSERSRDELEWSLRTLDASLAAAAAQGVELPADAFARLDALRDELGRRGSG